MADRVDPYGAYDFSVELGNITRAGFRECSGLQIDRNSVDYREGTDQNHAPRKLAGLVSCSDITLSRGLTNDPSLWQWAERSRNGPAERLNISITSRDASGNPLVRWNLYNAWPKSWTGPPFNATSDEIAVEQVTLTYERIELERWA